MQVTVLKFGTPQTVEVPEGTTLAAALSEAGIDPDAAIRFQGQTISGEEAQEIVLAPGSTFVADAPDVDHG